VKQPETTASTATAKAICDGLEIGRRPARRSGNLVSLTMSSVKDRPQPARSLGPSVSKARTVARMQRHKLSTHIANVIGGNLSESSVNDRKSVAANGGSFGQSQARAAQVAVARGAAPLRTYSVLSPRMTSNPRSRIFFRSVLRFRPSSCAARIWLPRVAARQMEIKGRSTSCTIRS